MMIVQSESRAASHWRHVAAACVLLCGLAVAQPALAQTAPDPHTAPSAPQPAQPAGQASLAHSTLKAATYKALTTLTGLGLFTYGTSSLVGGVGLLAFNSIQGSLSYIGTDYAFDAYWPKEPEADGTFDIAKSAKRNTWKYLLFQSVSGPIKFLSLYVATGSVATMVTIGSASLLATSGMFYVNNVLWDWIDWSGTAPAPPDPVPHADPK